MAMVATADIRNIALVGHAAAGKTTLVERLLHDAGVTHGRIGTVEEGSTVSDFEPEEKHHKHSLSSSLLQFMVEGKKINLVDTPGYPDFIGQAITALPAVDLAAIVIDASRGVQNVSRRMKELTDEVRMPNMIIINKMDDHGVDLEALVESIQEQMGHECLPINLPSKGGTAVADVFEHDSGETDFSSVEEAHKAIIEQVVEVDDRLMEKYLGGEEPGAEELHDVFEKALREAHITPILFVSARTGVGVKELLDYFVRLAPSPLESNPHPFDARVGENTLDWIPMADSGKPLCAHVFKVTTDPFVGKLALLRVHQGTLKPNSQVFLNDAKKPLRIGHVVSCLGKEHKDVEGVPAGDIAAVAKLEELHLGGVLHDTHELDNVQMHPLPLPRPMYGVGISPKSRADESKVGAATTKLMDEDATFVVERVMATKQTVARALGELHMRIMIEKLKNRFGVEVTQEPLRVGYKETISSKAEGHHRHKKQTGGAGQFGEVYLRVEPLPRDHEEGFEFVDDTFGGTVPKQFLPAIEKGVRQVLETGAIAGFPLTGVRVSVYDGKHHPVDSKEVAFVAAGKRAFIDAVQKARPVLLEPHVTIEVTAPSSHMGDITADLSGKRGRVVGTDILPGDMCVVKATAPLSETLNYASQLKSMTAGRGSYTMDYSHDESVPPLVQQTIVAAYKPHPEED